VVRVTPARPPCLLPALPDPSLAALHAQADGNHFDVGQQAMANLAAYDAAVKSWIRVAAACLEVGQ
jgi:hypothetical protein